MTKKNQASRKGDAGPYADRDAFVRIFLEDLDGLYQLSFLLTGNRETAERCFVSGIEDCVKENHVFREWARSWAKRTIIQNAIRELKPRPNRSESPAAAPALAPRQQSDSSASLLAFQAVVRLRDFDRFVFIMSVLERYSQHDCALLLGCPASEVREARARALEDLAGARVAFSIPSPTSSATRVSIGA